MGRKHFHVDFYFIPFSDWDTGYTLGVILTLNGSNDVLSQPSVPFWGSSDKTLIFGGQPQNILGREFLLYFYCLLFLKIFSICIGCIFAK